MFSLCIPIIIILAIYAAYNIGYNESNWDGLKLKDFATVREVERDKVELKQMIEALRVEMKNRKLVK